VNPNVMMIHYVVRDIIAIRINVFWFWNLASSYCLKVVNLPFWDQTQECINGQY